MLISLITILIFTLLFGIGYAAYIYKDPPLTWTLLSVFIGVSVSLVSITACLIVILSEVGLLAELWYVAAVPNVVFILTGVPMATGQIYKHYNHRLKNAGILLNIGKRNGAAK